MLTIGRLDGRIIDNSRDNCTNWIDDSMRFLDKRAFENFVIVLWNIWNSRNNFIFKGKKEDARLIWERAKAFYEEFWIHNFTSYRLIPKLVRSSKWRKPPANFIKINVGAAYANNEVGIGLLARDDDGFVLGVKRSTLRGLRTVSGPRLRRCAKGSCGHTIKVLTLLLSRATVPPPSTA